jgi:hypothetical protein
MRIIQQKQKKYINQPKVNKLNDRIRERKNIFYIDLLKEKYVHIM